MVRVSSAVCIGFLSVLLFYGLRTHFLALQYGISPYNQMEAASVELSTESDYTPPTYSIAAIIFHTAPVRACRYPPEDENDDGAMDHRLNLLLVLSSLFRLSCRGFIVIRPLTPNPITAIATGTPSDSQSGSRGRSACEIIIARRTP